jgi:hypothetical protein
MMTRLKRLAVLVCGTTFLSSLPLAAAQPYIYPNQGQSPQQEQFDKGQCYSWAVQQTGFDPTNPQVPMTPPPGMPAPQGGMFRGGAGGAALGAVGCAIGGDTGEGAAIGAAVDDRGRLLFCGHRAQSSSKCHDCHRKEYLDGSSYEV